MTDNILDELKHELKYYFDPILRRKIEIIDTLLALTLVALAIISLLSFQFYREKVTEAIVFSGYSGLFVASALLDFIPQLLNPFIAVLVGIASGLNVHFSVLAVILGGFFGSMIGFDMGRKYGFRFLCPLFNPPALRKILSNWQKYGNAIVFISALTPIPYVPLFFGALKMSWKDFLLFGVLPRLLSFAIVGYGYYFGLFQYNL